MNIRLAFVSFALGVGGILAFLCLLNIDQPPIVHAASFTVSKFTDTNDGVCDADCSLREAIVSANSNGQADTILLGAGTYALTLAGDDDAASTGDLDITNVLTLTGLGPEQTVIDANGIDRVLDIRPGAGTVVISGVALINGNVTGHGGGIYNSDADLVLINTTIHDNVASGDSPDGNGGGVYLDSGNMTLDGAQIYNNSATSGGGVYLDSGNVTLERGQIHDNSASYGGGGVFIVRDTATFTQTGDSDIDHNTAGYSGGGVYVCYGSATLTEGRIYNNSAKYGGGVYIFDEGTFTLNRSGIIAYNTAEEGGGIHVRYGSATLDGGIIHDNSASTNGGGVFVAHGSATFSGEIYSNSADNGGGGVFVAWDGATFTQTGLGTIARNSASYGGGVLAFFGQATLSEVCLLDNTATDNGGGLYQHSKGTISITHSCIVNNSKTSVVHAGGPTLVAMDNWWGVADGPSGAGPGNGDSVSLNVDFANFLTYPILGCPTLGPDLVIYKTVDPVGAASDQPITYALTFYNTGVLTATGVVITDIVPVSLTVNSVISSGVAITDTGMSPSFVWDVQDLAPGAKGAITLTTFINFPVSGVFTLTNRATIMTAMVDENPYNNTSTVSHIIGSYEVYLPVTLRLSAAP